MQEIEPLFLGRTFDDFLFRPQHSPVARRRDVDLSLPLVQGLDLTLPVVGANMDTVVGDEMAKALALEGGLGFLHRNASVDEQAAAVRYVKSRHSYVIDRPAVLERTATIAQARKAIRNQTASGILIEETRKSGILAGILSLRDMPLDRSADGRSVAEFMTPRGRLVTRSLSVTIEEAEQIMFGHRVEKLPLVDEENRIRGLITMRDLKLYKQKPYSTKDARGHLRVGAAVGAVGDYMKRAEALQAEDVDLLLLDVAHADADGVKKAVEEILARFRHVPLVVGNVATREGARWLAGLGVAAVKVGVGPGRGCRTRLETGAGVPQLQASSRGLAGCRGEGSRHRRWRSAERQGRLPRDRLRRVHGDAGKLPCRDRRVTRHRRRGPRHPPEGQDLQGHDVAGGGDRGGSQRGGGRRGPAHTRPRGSRFACPTWEAWSASWPGFAATCSRR